MPMKKRGRDWWIVDYMFRKSYSEI
jgi:hypothetical protein